VKVHPVTARASARAAPRGFSAELDRVANALDLDLECVQRLVIGRTAELLLVGDERDVSGVVRLR
jgi:hypothetical protein